MNKNKMVNVLTLAVISALALAADLDPYEQAKLVLNWKAPKGYPAPITEGLDVATLNTMLESGGLQWYEPRPQAEEWNGMVAQKFHAPLDVAWQVATEYELPCKVMPETFMTCKTESREGNTVHNVYRMKTSVVMYSYNFDMIDTVTEKPKESLHIETIDGGLAGRQIDMLFVPVDGGANTLVFIRYYGAMRSLGTTMQLALKVMPMVEPPTTVGAANYHLRALKNEAEKRAGYQTPQKPPELVDLTSLDLATLRKLNQASGGLIRETPSGKLIDVVAFTFIDAPEGRVWEVASDFEHYNDFFKGSENVLESRDGNTVFMLQEMAKFSLLVFDFGYELHSRYTLDPPRGFTYVAVDGLYQDSYGSLKILPAETPDKALLAATAKLNLDRDTGLVARIVKSGAFPVENMLNILGTQYTLAHIKIEAERREKMKKN